MFYDFSSTSREGWKYTYKGKELANLAKYKRDLFHDKEMSARDRLAKLLKDPKVSQDDRRIEDLKRDIEHNGKQYEACKVFYHEFSRAQDKDFYLSLGDVVYFGLV